MEWHDVNFTFIKSNEFIRFANEKNIEMNYLDWIKLTHRN